jgi:RNA polymerase sigma factor (sigma-70 family)
MHNRDPMNTFSEEEIIQGIEQDDSTVLRFVYREYFPYVESYIHQHGGSTDQAKDVFQEGMIVLYRKIASGEFSLVCKLSTYLYAVCKRIWIQENRKFSVKKTTYSGDMRVAEPVQHYEHHENDELMEILERNFETLSPECKQILTLYFNGCKNEEIRRILGFTSVAQVVDRKYRCKKTLIDRIQNDPSFIRSSNEKQE